MISHPAAANICSIQPVRSVPWFEDGNIILEAELEQFKVYRGILAANSEVFRDMFALASSDGQSSVDGCPIVHLSDAAQDVRIVLGALHDFRTRSLYFDSVTNLEGSMNDATV